MKFENHLNFNYRRDISGELAAPPEAVR